MSFDGFASRIGIAAVLAACIGCAMSSGGHAATDGPFAVVPFAASTPPAEIDRSASASFKERFEATQTSRVREILASLSYVPQTETTTASLPRRQKIVPAAKPLVGIASMYNPGDPKDLDAGNEELSSGEQYDPNGWTAAIRTDLRDQFGGVRFGKNYRPAFALITAGDKQVIVKINDIGPLKHGRIIDLNIRAMRYLDPTLQLGLIGNVSVTLLAGENIALGPVDDNPPVAVASRFDELLLR
ncbi:MAG TPA: RlpA-like double-psi beta-barrel domain-containing protein [Pseudolabrys sp.]